MDRITYILWAGIVVFMIALLQSLWNTSARKIKKVEESKQQKNAQGQGQLLAREGYPVPSRGLRTQPELKQTELKRR